MFMEVTLLVRRSAKASKRLLTPKADAEIQGHGLLRTENRRQLQVQPTISESVDQCCTRPLFQLKAAEVLAGPALFAEFTSHN